MKQTKGKVLKRSAVIIMAVMALLAIPVIWYFSVDWVTLPEDAPSAQQLYRAEFQNPADEAFISLKEAQQLQKFPGLTVAIAYQGTLLWSGAVGYADVEARTPATIDSQFRIGSTSKAVTATAIARAVAAGKLALDTPISEYHRVLPNPKWAALTLRQLLSHTAGLPGYGENTDLIGVWHTLIKQKHFPDVDDSLALFDQAELQYPAGQNFLYSSFDVNLASSVLQHATQQPFLNYLNAAVAEPLQLKSLQAADQPYAQQVKFYQQLSNKQVKPHWPVNLSQKWAGGGLAATSKDLAMLGMAWLNPEFIPHNIQQQFWTRQLLSNGDVNPQNYALGWRVSRRNFFYCDDKALLSKELTWIHHGGVSDGAQSWLVVYPEYQLVLAMNTNTVKENYCDFAGQAAAIVRPFMRQIAPELFVNEGLRQRSDDLQ